MAGQGGTGSLAADTGLGVPAGATQDVMYTPTATGGVGPFGDPAANQQKNNQQLVTQLQLATSVAQLGRGLHDDLMRSTRGPMLGSPPAARPPGATPYLPSALVISGHRRARPRRLSDLLGGA